MASRLFKWSQTCVLKTLLTPLHCLFELIMLINSQLIIFVEKEKDDCLPFYVNIFVKTRNSQVTLNAKKNFRVVYNNFKTCQIATSAKLGWLFKGEAVIDSTSVVKYNKCKSKRVYKIANSFPTYLSMQKCLL